MSCPRLALPWTSGSRGGGRRVLPPGRSGHGRERRVRQGALERSRLNAGLECGSASRAPLRWADVADAVDGDGIDPRHRSAAARGRDEGARCRRIQAQGRTGPRAQGWEEVRADESSRAAGPGRDGARRHVGVRAVIARNTATFAFNQKFENVRYAARQEADCDLQTWFGGEHSLCATEEVVGLGEYGKTLTVLTALDIEEQLEELEELEEERDLSESWTPKFRRR